MDYKIVLDSCGELTYKMKESGIYHTAVLSMLVDGDTSLEKSCGRKKTKTGINKSMYLIRVRHR